MFIWDEYPEFFRGADALALALLPVAAPGALVLDELHVVDHAGRRGAEAEHGLLAAMRQSEITDRDNVHADERVAACEVPHRDADVIELNIIRESEVHEEPLDLLGTVHTVNDGDADRLELERFHDSV
jgi:hypothetical protein